MQALVSLITLLLVLTLSAWPLSGNAQSDRDFVFDDEEGHLVIRFTGVGADGLSAAQAYEVSNSEFSTMVHDRTHADLAFAAEALDPEWARSMEPQIREHVGHIGIEFSDILVECRAMSCMLLMEQPDHPGLHEHLEMLETVQTSLDSFIAERGQLFEPSFMITAYDQAHWTAHIKAFLRRAEASQARQTDNR